MPRPVGDHALLSDCNGAALVTSDAAVVWWCGPRFDSPSCFSAALDDDAGHLRLVPAGENWACERRYLDDTLVLETTLRRGDAAIRVTDCLALGPGERGLEPGASVPHALVRVVEGLAGEAELDIEVVPRLEYGLAVPRVVPTERGPETLGGCERLFVDALDLPWDVDGTRARARPTLRARDRVELVVRRVPGIEAVRPPALDARSALADTIAAWRSWSNSRQQFDGPFADEVRLGARVLQGLTYQPTGAIVAAATTSFPDRGGDDHAWDYRYGWLRDAGLVARALDASQDAAEADRYFGWMAKAAVTCGHADHVQVMFGVEGERDLTERRLDHLAGRDGAPVRVGNAAWTQLQLDVLGEVFAVAARRQDGIEFDEVTQGLLRQIAERAARGWREPDAGIWESREARLHHTAAKAGCWMALDRAARLAPRLGPGAAPRRWAQAAAEVREETLRRAWNPERGALCATLDGDALDAGALLCILTKMLDATDERAAATCRVLEEVLGDGSGLLRRSEARDDDTAFLLCSGWLAECHARGGRIDDARRILEGMRRSATDVGLLAERAAFGSHEPVGNLPLALSHASFITACVALREAEAAGGAPPSEGVVGDPGRVGTPDAPSAHQPAA